VRKRKTGAGLKRLHGIAAFFSGAGGTGERAAGDVLALDVHRVDLSRVVSKYIGETEKNLNRVFAEAKKEGAILFFDEAGALFGKRTDVHDSHDRYANAQIALLLRRMEGYAGIAVLATKPRRAIDEAARRRRRRPTVAAPIPKARKASSRIGSS
jgi:SpoVK/Ycf46/Vps4 family AAA+-type ATPase